MKAESDEEIEQDERRNPVKRAEKEKEFKTLGPNDQIFTNPNEAYAAATKYDKSYKLVKNVHPKNKNIQIIDFSLNCRGPQEDEVYSSQQYFRNNIRRGNTLIYDVVKKQSQWGRRGLMKFFDISDKSIQAMIDENLKAIDKKYKNVHYAVFGELQNTLSCNEELEEKDKAKVHVYRLNKANGENAQVSFYPDFDEWLISSKNVSVLVKTREDLKLYQGERYEFALEIADTWFNIIEKKDKKEIELLKKDLIGRTFVGEYCGSPLHQHLVKYGDITIFFYAVVENDSAETCISPAQAFKIFEKHQIPIVKNHEKAYYGKYSSFVELGTNLKTLFSEVATASIFEEEEGSVLYFVLEKPKVFCEYISDRYLQKTVPIPEKFEQRESWWKVCSLGKLKTLEYRILRKLRQKLKFFCRLKNKEDTKEKNMDDQKKLQQKYGSFEKETKHLLKKETLTKPIEYYFVIALFAFEYTFKNRKSTRNLEVLNDRYLDFLSVVFWCVENKRQITPAIMNDEQLHQELRKTTWLDYSVEIAKDYPQILEKLCPKYAKIKKSMDQEDQEEEEIEKKEEVDE